MNQTTTLAARCGELFNDYPLAVRHGGMLLGVTDGEDVSVFVLTEAGASSYLIRPRRQSGAVRIGPGSPDVPEWAATAITGGIPVPAGGSLLGWAPDGTVTALVAFDNGGGPLPVFSPMPEATAAQWPPFAGEPVVGWWLWEYVRDGHLTDLSRMIGSSEGAVFWVDTVDLLGSGCIAVARNVTDGGIVLPRGVYAYYVTLAEGSPVPSLDDLLADPSRVDLGPRFPLASPRGGDR